MITAGRLSGAAMTAITKTQEKPRKWRKPKKRVLPMPTKIHKVKPDYKREDNRRVIEQELEENVS